MTQAQAFEILKTGASVFLTGQAGCGKTFLLNKYINYLKENKVSVGVTASTGIAATHLNGRTIHSWCGMGIGEKLSAKEMKNLVHNEQYYNRIKYTQTLIIDEVSMLNAGRLDLINSICQSVRQNLLPFGGLQVILAGDFFQLPPVGKTTQEKDFIFKAQSWQELDPAICYLDEQYRHNDIKFLDILNKIRMNKGLEQVKELLQERLHMPIESEINPTKLFTHNSNVDAYNKIELTKLPGEPVIFSMRCEGISQLVDKIKESCLAPEHLELRVGAVVMFVRNNFDKGYVNGTIGVVRSFSVDNYPIIETFSGEEIIALPEAWSLDEDNQVLASVFQVPLRLAWAITIHKSQGMSLDCAEMDLSKTFEYGMGYVALSRVKSLSGIKLLGLNDMALQVNKKMIKLDQLLQKQSLAAWKIFSKMKKEKRQALVRDFLKNSLVNNKLV